MPSSRRSCVAPCGLPRSRPKQGGGARDARRPPPLVAGELIGRTSCGERSLPLAPAAPEKACGEHGRSVLGAGFVRYRRSRSFLPRLTPTASTPLWSSGSAHDARSHVSDPHCVTTEDRATIAHSSAERVSEKPGFGDCRRTCATRGDRSRPDCAGARRNVRHFIPRRRGLYHIGIFGESGRFGGGPLAAAAWAIDPVSGPLVLNLK